MIRKIIDVKNPILRQKAKEIAKIDKKILELIKDMRDTLEIQKDPEGVGLAAPQIGKSLRIFIVDYKNLKRVIINPIVIVLPHSAKASPRGKDTKEKDILEGCLSLPHYYGPIKRDNFIKIEYLDENGKMNIEEFTGFNAQIIQHEIDHLNGSLFIDKIIEQKAPLYKFHGDEWEEVELI